MSAIEVPALETGVVRVFSVDLPEEDIPSFVEPGAAAGGNGEAARWPLQEALGATHLDPAFVEAFPVSNVAPLGLSGYLTEGMGLPEADIAADRGRLDALSGQVLIVGSKAFGGVAQSLDPKPPLRLVGTYRETPQKPVIGSIETESAKGTLESPAPPARRSPGKSGNPRIIALLGLVGAALIVLILVLVAR